MPDMQGAYNEIKDKDVNIIGIVEDGKDNEAKVKELLSANKVAYTNIIPDDKLYDELISLVSSFPTSILVNEKGEILKVKVPDYNKEVVKLPDLNKQKIVDIFDMNLKK